MAGMMEKIREALTRKAADTRSTYRKIVEQIADDKTPDIDTVFATLRDAGKDEEQLQAAVDQLIERRGWAAIVTGEPAIEKQVEQAAAAEAKEREAFAALKKQHLAKLEELEAESRRLNRERDKIRQARERLHQTYVEPAEVAELSVEAKRVFENLTDRERGLRVLEAQKTAAEQKRDSATSEMLAEQIKTAHRDIAALQKRRTEIEARQKELAQDALKP